MSLSILEIVESSLLNIANRYAVLTADPMVEFNILKDFDEQLNDIMERYNKLKGLQSTYTAEELQIKLIEFNLIVQDIQSKINSGFFTGPKGETGLIGLTGPQGPAGAGGEVGPQGPAGANGETGPIGLTGPQGPAGLNGPAGANGETGPIGLTGPQGPAGLNGEVGPQGPAGANGETGPIGLTGPQGPAGENGLDGSVTFESLTPEQIEILKGETGPIGLTGPQGPAGVDGLHGSIGPQGPAGLDGQDGILDFNSLTAEQKQEIASFVPSSSDLLSSLFLLNDTTKAYTYIKTSIKFDSCFYLVILNYLFTSAIQQKYKQGFFSVVDSVFYPTVAGDVNYSLFINNDGFLCIKCNNIGKTMIRIQCQEKPFKVLEVVYYDYDTHPNYVPKTNITSYFP
jgi:hypothetical protein